MRQLFVKQLAIIKRRGTKQMSKVTAKEIEITEYCDLLEEGDAVSQQSISGNTFTVLKADSGNYITLVQFNSGDCAVLD